MEIGEGDEGEDGWGMGGERFEYSKLKKQELYSNVLRIY